MSYAAILASAAAQAQAILAPMSDPDGDGEFTLSGATYTGVLNLRSDLMQPGPNGLERIEELEIIATAAQFDTAPAAAPRVALTALGRTWRLTRAALRGPHYHLTCVPA